MKRNAAQSDLFSLRAEDLSWTGQETARFRKSGRRKGARQREGKEEGKVKCREDEDGASWERWALEGTSRRRVHDVHDPSRGAAARAQTRSFSHPESGGASGDLQPSSLAEPECVFITLIGVLESRSTSALSPPDWLSASKGQTGLPGGDNAGRHSSSRPLNIWRTSRCFAAQYYPPAKPYHLPIMHHTAGAKSSAAACGLSTLGFLPSSRPCSHRTFRASSQRFLLL